MVKKILITAAVILIIIAVLKAAKGKFTMQATAAGLMGAMGTMYGNTRGLRNNNPLNIEAGQPWEGATGSDGRFATFKNLDYGCRAGLKLLKNYTARGYDTISKIITRWAPPHENDTAGYIAFVANETGINPNQPITQTDSVTLIKIASAMAVMETGGRIPYQIWLNGWNLI